MLAPWFLSTACLFFQVINYDPYQRGPMKIIVNIEGHVQVPLDQPPLQQTKDNRRDDAELAVLPEQRLQAEIDKLTISE